MQKSYELLTTYSEAISNPQFHEAFREIQADVHKTAREKGWWENERNNGEAIALMHSEVSEGVDGWFDADDKVPEFYAIEAELADCVIRIMDLSQARKWDIVTPITADMSHKIFLETAAKKNEHFSLSKIHSALSKALEALRKPKEDESKEVGEALAECVARIFMFALVFKIKVAEALCAKAEMNKGREYKHGGKAF